jgi:hypothetical protein
METILRPITLRQINHQCSKHVVIRSIVYINSSLLTIGSVIKIEIYGIILATDYNIPITLNGLACFYSSRLDPSLDN